MPGVLFCCLAHQAHRGLPPLRLGSYSVDWLIRHLKGHAGWGPTLQFSAQAFDGPASPIVHLPVLACGGRESMVTAPPSRRDLAVSPCLHGRPTSSTGSSHHNLLPHIPSIHLFTVNSSLRPGTSPQSPNSTSQPLHLPGDLHPRPGYGWLWQGQSDSHPI